MSNSILDLVNSQRSSQTLPQGTQMAKNLMAQIKNSQNPQMMLQNIAMQNPNFNNILNMVQMSNLTPQQFAQKMAQ